MKVSVLVTLTVLAAAIGGSSLLCCGGSGPTGSVSSDLGKKAPSLSATDHQGKSLNLEELSRDAYVLVYFYPKDSTPGCTKEACALRDVWKRYQGANVSVIGVSSDSLKKHKKFAEKHSLPFSLVADTDGQWAKAFGVGSTLGYYSRTSFLIGPGHLIERIYEKVDPGIHANEVLKDVEELRQGR